jgi:Zn-dependent alcohol dehydrogenase
MNTVTNDAGASARPASLQKARAAVMREQRKPFQIEDIEVSAPRADEILVRMVGTGICHSDIVCRDAFPMQMPVVLGHEGAGVVEAVGSDVTSLKAGDHVVLSFNSCSACPNCEGHEPAYCYNFVGQNFGGVRPEDNSTPLSKGEEKIFANFFGQSSFASYAITRASKAVKVDKQLPLALLGPLGCGIQTGAGAIMNSMKVRPGRSVAIFGAGSVGLSAVMAAKVVGASQIIVVEPNAARCELALELGATAVIDPKATPDVLTRIREVSGGGVAYSLDTTGIPAVIGIAGEVLMPNGLLGMLGMSAPEAPMPMTIMSLVMRGIGVKAIIEGDSDPQTFIPQLVSLYKEGKFPFDRLIKTFPFEKINDAIAASEDGSVIKPVVLF